MSEAAITEQQPESAPVEAPSQLTPANEPDELSRLLTEYDEATAAKSEPEPVTTDPAAGNAGDAQTTELDALLAHYTAPDPKLAQLEGELNGVRSELAEARHQAHIAAEQEAFGKYADELQSRLPDHCPPDYARNALLSAAAVDRSLAVAWDTRNLSAAERQRAAAELQQAIQLYQQIQRTPDGDPRKQQALNLIVQNGQRLEMIVAGPALLRKTLLDIESKARKHIAIDSEATALKSEIAFHMKSGAGKRVPEPPPNFGRMSDNEFRNWKRENLGWE
jgi:hypothetical protein